MFDAEAVQQQQGVRRASTLNSSFPMYPILLMYFIRASAEHSALRTAGYSAYVSRICYRADTLLMSLHM
jgi:hypothetical protein